MNMRLKKPPTSSYLTYQHGGRTKNQSWQSVGAHRYSFSSAASHWVVEGVRQDCCRKDLSSKHRAPGTTTTGQHQHYSCSKNWFLSYTSEGKLEDTVLNLPISHLWFAQAVDRLFHNKAVREMQPNLCSSSSMWIPPVALKVIPSS